MKIIITHNSSIIAGRIYCLAKELVSQGHEVHFVLWELPYNVPKAELLRQLATSFTTKKYTFEDFAVYKFWHLPYFWPVINNVFFSMQLRHLFASLNADVIITETYTNETRVPDDLPYIYDLADDYGGPADIYGSWFYKLAFKILGVRSVMAKQCRGALAVTAVSELLVEYGQQFQDNVYKVPNGVEGELIRKVSKQDTKNVNPYSMIYVSGFGPWSRSVETLRAIKELRKEFPQVELTMIGKGTEVPLIEEFIATNKMQNYARYLGYVSDRQKIFAAINEHSIGLNISQKNKWRDAAHPIKVLEYSALGKKVVSTDLNEVIALNFPNVFVFSDAKNNNLKSAMRRALQYSAAPQEYTKTAKYVLTNYSWSKSARSLVSIINKSIK